MEMFPGIPKNVFERMILDDHLPVETVIEMMVDRKVIKPSTLPNLLSEIAEKMIDEDDDIVLKMSRAVIYNKAKHFYKASLHNPANLRRNLVVSFHGEEGVDVGALRNDFFCATLRGITEELFEGRPERLLPRNYWGSEHDFEIAGTAVAHSILSGGPGFACLHPAIYSQLAVHAILDEVEDMPCAEDIPTNASTIDMLSLIEEVRQF